MLKKSAFFAALAALIFALAGCDIENTNVEPAQTSAAVDIIMPYATTTPLPQESISPDAVHISGKGAVTINDESILVNDVGGGSAVTDGSIYTQLRLGDTGDAVSALQGRLGELGYFSEGISGVFDENTQSAVMLFERGYGVMQTGIATSGLQERLFSEAALAYGTDEYNAAVESFYVVLGAGDVGGSVTMLQTRLLALGYPITDITGVYDEQTVRAVRLFYQMYNQEPRDYAIIDLQKALYSSAARAYDPTIAATPAPEDSAEDDFSLRPGDSGTRVTQMQLRLTELGYMTGASGSYDEQTAGAVTAFQTACRLEADGVASVEIQRELYSDAAPRFGEQRPLYVLLQWGDSGEAVSLLQTRLFELGYYSGTIDGVFSDEMVAIIKRFQSTAGLEQTGVASVEMQEILFSESAPLSPARMAEAQEEAAAATVIINPLMRGDISEDVGSMQTRLAELGFYRGTVDGDFGAGTQNAVKAFQKALGVEQTGEASQGLLNVMYSNVAPESGEVLSSGETHYTDLVPGDTGDEVIALQRRLWELGYLNKEDISQSIGTYEAFTSTAVNAAMKTMGCRRRDGQASAEFLAYIFSDESDEIIRR